MADNVQILMGQKRMKVGLKSPGTPGVDECGDAFVDFPDCGIRTSFTEEDWKRGGRPLGGRSRSDDETAKTLRWSDGIPYILGHPPGADWASMSVADMEAIQGISRDSKLDYTTGRARIKSTIRVYEKNQKTGKHQGSTIEGLKSKKLPEISDGYMYEEGAKGEEFNVRPTHIAGLKAGEAFCKVEDGCGVGVKGTGDVDTMSGETPEAPKPPEPAAPPAEPPAPEAPPPEVDPIAEAFTKATWADIVRSCPAARDKADLLKSLTDENAEAKDLKKQVAKYKEEEKERVQSARDELVKEFRTQGETRMGRDNFESIYKPDVLEKMSDCEFGRMLASWEVTPAPKDGEEPPKPPADPSLHIPPTAPVAPGDKPEILKMEEPVPSLYDPGRTGRFEIPSAEPQGTPPPK